MTDCGIDFLMIITGRYMTSKQRRIIVDILIQRCFKIVSLLGNLKLHVDRFSRDVIVLSNGRLLSSFDEASSTNSVDTDQTPPINSVNPDQIAPIGAVLSGSTPFASILTLVNNVSKIQTANDSIRRHFQIRFL